MPLPVMLDIETAGLRPGAAILEIAAATFDEHGTIHETFLTTIDVLDAVGQGLILERGTAAWHRELGTETPRGETLWNALSRFSLWMKDQAPEQVWAWGMDFERPMLDAAFHRIHAVLPWHYTASLDARTVWKLAFPDQRPPKRTHRALEDVQAQVRDLTRALHALKPLSATAFPANCKRPDLCLLSETCQPCAICPNVPFLAQPGEISTNTENHV